MFAHLQPWTLKSLYSWTVFAIGKRLSLLQPLNPHFPLVFSDLFWSLSHVSNAATISPGVLAMLFAGAGHMSVVASSLIMRWSMWIGLGWSEKGLKTGWQKQYFWICLMNLSWVSKLNFLHLFHMYIVYVLFFFIPQTVWPHWRGSYGKSKKGPV